MPRYLSCRPIEGSHLSHRPALEDRCLSKSLTQTSRYERPSLHATIRGPLERPASPVTNRPAGNRCPRGRARLRNLPPRPTTSKFRARRGLTRSPSLPSLRAVGVRKTCARVCMLASFDEEGRHRMGSRHLEQANWWPPLWKTCTYGPSARARASR